MKAISISLAKIDYDFGEPYIKIIASCPREYHFDRMQVDIHPLIEGKWGKELWFDVSSLLYDDEGELRKNIIMSLPVKSLNGFTGNAMYEIHLGASSEVNGDSLSDILILSDILNIFKYLVDGILSADKCNGIDDDIIKKYLALYAHQQAMASGEITPAKEFYKLLMNGLSNCPTSDSNGIKCGCYDRR